MLRIFRLFSRKKKEVRFQVEEECRDVRPFHWIDTLKRDMGFAFRMLRKHPSFTAVAVITLAFGIGANTAIFSVLNTALLQPLPYPDQDRLVAVMRSPGDNWSISIPKFFAYARQTKVFRSITLYDPTALGINLAGDGRPEQVKGIHASADYFDVFGATVALGRTYNKEEDRPGGPRVVVISNGLWRSRFGGDPAIIGKAIELGGDEYNVIGVLGAAFKSYPAADAWLPLRADPGSTNHGLFFRCVARMKPAVTIGQAQAALRVAAEEFRKGYPGWLNPRESATAAPLRDALVGDVRSALLILAGAVGFVLLIACANVANLQLARTMQRESEIAIRTALGSGRRRIICQLLTESVMLSLMGGALGLGLGFAGVRTLLAMNPVDIPRIGQHGAGVILDWRVLSIALLVSFASGVLFGLLPAFAVPWKSRLARVLAGMLYGAKPSDPVTFAGVIVTLVSVSLLACWFPARRAMRVDPITALRHE